MSKSTVVTLHIEWTPDWVRAVNIATGQSAEAAGIDRLGSILSGHREALVGVSRKHVFFKTMRMPKAAPQDLRQILSVQLAQVFPLPIAQLAFDFIQTSDLNVEGSLTLVSAIRADDLRRIRAELQQSGIKARVLPIAMAAPAVAARSGLADAVLVEATVDRQAGGTSSTPDSIAFDVVQKGSIRLSRVAAPSGSNGLSAAGELKRTLAAAQAPDLRVIAADGIDMPQAIRAAGSTLNLLHEAPAFGFELAEDRANEAARAKATRMRSAVLMFLAAALLVIGVWSDRQGAVADIQKYQASWQRRENKLKSDQSAEVSTAQQATGIQADMQRAFEPGQSLSDAIAVIGDVLPKGAWLNSVTLERGKPADIRGTAQTSDQVAQFVNALGSNPRFRDIRLLFANGAELGKFPIVQFEVSAVCVGNLPMPEPAKTSGSIATVRSTSSTQ